MNMEDRKISKLTNEGKKMQVKSLYGIHFAY